MTTQKLITQYYNLTVPRNHSDAYENMLNNALFNDSKQPLYDIISTYKHSKDLSKIREGDIINLKKNRTILDIFIVWNDEMVPLPQTIAGANSYKLIIPECITPTKFPIDYWYQPILDQKNQHNQINIEFVPVSRDYVSSRIHKYVDKETYQEDCGVISQEDTESIDLEQDYDCVYNFEFDDYQFELVDDFCFQDDLFFVDFYDKEIVSYPQSFTDKIDQDISKIRSKYFIK